MASRREQVILAVIDLLEETFPNAGILRNASKPEKIGSSGNIIVRDGDLGEPEITFSPLTYIYDHRIEVQFAVNGVGDPDAVLDAMMAQFGAMIDANRRLGGLCDFMQAEPPAVEVIEALGAVAARSAETAIIATYGTSNPLT